MKRDRLRILIEPGSFRRYFVEEYLGPVEDLYEVTRVDRGGLDESAVSAQIREAEVVMTGWGAPGLTPANLDAAENLKLVAHFGGSCQMLSTEHGMPKGITYLNCAAGMVDAMAEATLGMMLALGHQMVTADRRLRLGGDWSHGYALSTGVTGKTIGVYGLGHIGRKVAEVLRVFRPRLLGYDPFVSAETFATLGVAPVDSLDELCQRSEILTIHAGWTAETTGSLSRERLAKLPDGALVINNARTPIVDEKALLAEVRRGRLKAALNMVPAKPELYGERALREQDGLLYTSGATNVSDVYVRGMSEMLCADLVRYAKGEPLRQEVTPEWVARTT